MDLAILSASFLQGSKNVQHQHDLWIAGILLASKYKEIFQNWKFGDLTYKKVSTELLLKLQSTHYFERILTFSDISPPGSYYDKLKFLQHAAETLNLRTSNCDLIIQAFIKTIPKYLYNTCKVPSTMSIEDFEAFAKDLDSKTSFSSNLNLSTIIDNPITHSTPKNQPKAIYSEQHGNCLSNNQASNQSTGLSPSQSIKMGSYTVSNISTEIPIISASTNVQIQPIVRTSFNLTIIDADKNLYFILERMKADENDILIGLVIFNKNSFYGYAGVILHKKKYKAITRTTKSNSEGEFPDNLGVLTQYGIKAISSLKTELPKISTSIIYLDPILRLPLLEIAEKKATEVIEGLVKGDKRISEIDR
uniref:CMP/dCMP-type deaminase domain-containing protein n=1 Tax=Strongyloides papillosus TaxID=174720 RepID=A0A0N5BGS6_STREA